MALSYRRYITHYLKDARYFQGQHFFKMSSNQAKSIEIHHHKEISSGKNLWKNQIQTKVSKQWPNFVTKF